MTYLEEELIGVELDSTSFVKMSSINLATLSKMNHGNQLMISYAHCRQQCQGRFLNDLGTAILLQELGTMMKLLLCL